jgi:hypothetical protein
LGQAEFSGGSGGEVCAMNDASKRKLAEIKARAAAGNSLYKLKENCIEFLMLSLTEFGLEKSDNPNDGKRQDCNTKAESTNHVKRSNSIISDKNRLKSVSKNSLKRLLDFFG